MLFVNSEKGTNMKYVFESIYQINYDTIWIEHNGMLLPLSSY